ncbi:hypothetical protein [Sporomusa silvacetica]
MERKEDMKKRGLKSPDLGDALALATYVPQARNFIPDISRKEGKP